MVSEVTGDVIVPPPGTGEEPDAMLVTEPLSRSACVTKYVPVQVIDAVGARPGAATAGQLTDGIRLSVTVIGPVKRVLPVLVTT